MTVALLASNKRLRDALQDLYDGCQDHLVCIRAGEALGQR